MGQFNSNSGLKSSVSGTRKVEIVKKNRTTLDAKAVVNVTEKTKKTETTTSNYTIKKEYTDTRDINEDIDAEADFKEETDLNPTELKSDAVLNDTSQEGEPINTADTSPEMVETNSNGEENLVGDVSTEQSDGSNADIPNHSTTENSESMPEHQGNNPSEQNPNGEKPNGENQNGENPNKDSLDQNKEAKGDIPNHDPSNQNGDNKGLGNENKPNGGPNNAPSQGGKTDNPGSSSSTNKLGNPTGNGPKPGDSSDPANKKLQDNKHNRSNTQIGKKGNSLSNSLNKINNKLSLKNHNKDEEEIDDDDDSTTDSMIKGLSLKVKIKILAILVLIGLGAIAAYILISCIAFMLNPEAFATGVSGTEVQLIYPEDDPKHQQELDYYAELERKCTEESAVAAGVNKAYVHYILYYRYFTNMYSTKKGEEQKEPNFDFKNMKNNIDKVIKLIKEVSDPPVDYTRETGNFYKKLLNDSFLTSYYKDFFKNVEGGSSEKNRKELLDQIFGLAEKDLEQSGEDDDSDLPDVQQVIDTTDYIEYELPDGNTDTLNIVNYMYGAVYAYMDISVSTSAELVKANSVILLSKMLAGKALDSESISVEMNNEGLLYCNPAKGCSKSVNGSLYYYKDGIDGDVYKKMAPPKVQQLIKQSVDSAFGNVLVNGNNEIVSVDILTSCDGDYKKELSTKYSSYKVANILDNNYTDPYVKYEALSHKTNAIFYQQTDYTDRAFCGRNNATIKSSGCGVTSMAIVASTLKNSKSYGPNEMMEEAYKGGYCGKGISGTKASFFRYEAQKLGLKYEYVSKNGDLQKVLNALNSDNALVIILVGSGDFTSSGHYMVLGGVDGNEETVYVYDPYTVVNKSKRNTGNGWYSFNNVIAKQTKGYYIISKG